MSSMRYLPTWYKLVPRYRQPYSSKRAMNPRRNLGLDVHVRPVGLDVAPARADGVCGVAPGPDLGRPLVQALQLGCGAGPNLCFFLVSLLSVAYLFLFVGINTHREGERESVCKWVWFGTTPVTRGEDEGGNEVEDEEGDDEDDGEEEGKEY